MTNPLRTAADYELFLYTLTDQYPSIKRSTIAFVRRGVSLARVIGELYFDHGIRVVVRERILYRIPAPGMSFTQPNLPQILHEIEEFIEKISSR